MHRLFAKGEFTNRLNAVAAGNEAEVFSLQNPPSYSAATVLELPCLSVTVAFSVLSNDLEKPDRHETRTADGAFDRRQQ